MTVLRLNDGKMFDTVTKTVLDDEPEQNEGQDSRLPIPRPHRELRLEDLPTDHKLMNVICAVAGYKLLGLINRDIALAIGCTDDQLQEILEGEMYDKVYNDMIVAFVNGQENTARDILAKNAIHAADTLVTTMRKSRSESNRVKAAESILNRNNIGPDSHHGLSGPGLTIKIVKDTKSEITISM
jgi:hypothetical protein